MNPSKKGTSVITEVPGSGGIKVSYRIGNGYDVHPLHQDLNLVLGGVEIPFEKGLAGHSDADVLTHAVIDALLGAASLGDIGTHFPAGNDKYKDISSLILLENVLSLLQQERFEIVNIDSIVVLQRPRLSSYIKEMRQNLAHVLRIETGLVSVKATTTESLGFAGREEGVSAYAVALIRRRDE